MAPLVLGDMNRDSSIDSDEYGLLSLYQNALKLCRMLQLESWDLDHVTHVLIVLVTHCNSCHQTVRLPQAASQRLAQLLEELLEELLYSTSIYQCCAAQSRWHVCVFAVWDMYMMGYESIVLCM